MVLYALAMIMGVFLGCGITSIILKHKDEKPTFLRKGIYDPEHKISLVVQNFKI